MEEQDTKEIIQQLLRGLSFLEVAELVGMKPEEVQRVYEEWRRSRA